MFDLKNRVVAITGASSGLGVQMAKGFAAQGADLVIMARMERLEAFAEEIRAMGVKCLPVKCDVTDSAQVDAAAKAAEEAAVEAPAKRSSKMIDIEADDK